MGIIIPKESAKRAAASAAAAPPETKPGTAEVSLLAPKSDAPPVGPPNANSLNRADFPARELPPVQGAREPRFQVVFRQSVLDEIHAHGKSSMEAEVCGVLVGEIYADAVAPWAYVQHCIRGNNAVGKQTQVTITSDTWSRIHETLEKQYAGKKIIGWYHTHPGFGIFLSGMDLFIQDNFFNQPWQVATVYDPHSGDAGTFIWRAGKSDREESLVENDVVVAATEASAPSQAIVDLTRRVKTLERRVELMLTGVLCLVFLALIAPLLFYALAPEAIRKLPLLRGAPPAATQPAVAPAPIVPAPGAAAPVPAPLAPPAPPAATQKTVAVPAPRPAAEVARSAPAFGGAASAVPRASEPKKAESR